MSLDEARRLDWALTHALRAALERLRDDAAPLPTLKLSEPDTAEALRLAATVHLEALAAVGLRALGAPVSDATLAHITQRALGRALLFQPWFKKLRDLFERLDVRHAWLKGLWSDANLFGGRGLRGTSDLDVLIDASAVGRVIASLLELGAKPLIVEEHRATVAQGHARLFTLPSTTGGLILDLHTRLLDPMAFRDPSREVLERRRQASTVMGAMWGLEPTDALLFAAGNLAQDGYSGRTKLALDAAALLEAGADLDAADERARASGLSRSLEVLLRCTGTRFGRGPYSRLQRPASTRTKVLCRVAGVDGPPDRLPGALTTLLAADTVTDGLLALTRRAGLRLVDTALERTALAKGALSKIAGR